MSLLKTSSRKALAPLLGAAFTLLPLTSLTAAAQETIVLTSESGPRATILIDREAPELTREAAEKLALYISRISGAKIAIAHETSEVQTPSIIWVGAHRELAERHANADLALTQPEESLILTEGNDIILLGSDKLGSNGKQSEAGTYLAVTTFIEEQLGVRWLWPGELGTDIPSKPEIAIAPTSSRYTPQLHLRRINMTNFMRAYQRKSGAEKRKGLSKRSQEEIQQHVSDPVAWLKEKDRQTREWLNHHRIEAPPTGSTPNAVAGSLASYQNQHAFRDWYDRYGAAHPEWFALQPDGTRDPYPTRRDVKMCVSNPEVAEQWVQNAKQYFLANPDATTFAAGENDYGWQGYCVCKDCLAMDNKKAEPLEQDIRWAGSSKRSYALTDRYAKFWNRIAKRLKEELPDREVNVSTYAYHVTRPAPTVRLEPNIVPAFVGMERRFYHVNSQANTLDQRRIWKGWWEAVGQRNAIIWRPNLMARSIAMPYTFTKRHAENMRFMADHGMLGATFNSSHSYWAVEGPQLYLMAKMLWNPRLDADALLRDYYQRAFGPAAPHMASYFQVYEDLFTRLTEEYGKYGYSVMADPPRLFRESRPASEKPTAGLGKEGIRRHHRIEDQAAAHLAKAKEAASGADPVYARRVEFMKVGFDFIQAHLDCIEAMNDFTDDPSDKNRELAEAAAERRLAILRENADNFALNYLEMLLLTEKHPDYLGPPNKAPRNRKKKEKALIQDLEA